MRRRDIEVRRNPVPSLLRSLMTEHLDPGYEAAAEDREMGHLRSTRISNRIWVVVGAVLVGLIFGVASGQASGRAPGTQQVRLELVEKVHDARGRTAELVTDRDALRGQSEQARAAVLAGDSEGVLLLGELQALEAAASTAPVTGPGLVVTLTDPAGRPDLSDSSQRGSDGKAAVLDRDIQSVVNALWAGGAEAVAVGNVRIGPGVTIRQAGGAMLVDNQPVFSPYTVSAIGPQGQMQTDFVVSDAYLRMASVEQLYGIGFAIAEDDALELPAAPMRAVRLAHEEGTP